MSETDTPDAPRDDDKDAMTETPESQEASEAGVEASIEPTLSLEEFGLLEGLTPPVLAAMRQWVRLQHQARYATATEWRVAMQQMQSYVPH